MRACDVAIIGYGIAGIAAAILLRRAGHRVTHFEGAPELLNAGAGLLIQPVGLNALRELDLYDSVVGMGSRIAYIGGDARDGSVLMRVRYDEFEARAFALGIERRHLLAALSSRDEARQDVRFAHVVRAIDAERGVVETNDRDSFGPFDLIVAADGVYSTVRASLPTTLLKTSTQYATSALVTVLDDVASTAGDGLIQRFDGARHVSYWPVGERRVAVALNRFDESEPIASLVAFTRIASSIQPAVARWLTEQTQPPTLHHYRYADIELSRFVHRRVALIGDAAHAMSPQLGLGSSMGLLDAVELARALEKSDNVASALDAYDAIRRPIVAAHQKNSRFVTPLFQSSAMPLVLTRDRMLSQLGRFSVARRMMLSHLF